MSDHEISIVEQGSDYIDEHYQGPEYSYMHAMRDGSHRQLGTDAHNETINFISTTMKKAGNAFSAASAGQGNADDAWFLFGQAMHPVMDYTSPAHTDVSGNPIPWCGIFGSCSHTFQHGGDGYFPNPASIEDLDALNKSPEVQAFENIAIRNWYKELTGKGCMPGRK